MNLAELQKLGAIPSPEFKKATIRFTIRGEEVAADVFAREAVPADTEAAAKWAKENDSSYLFAVVSRCIRFGENAEEQATPEQVSTFNNAFFNALYPLALTGVEEAAKKKSLPLKKSSTANSSSTASAARPSRKRSKT